MLNIILFGKPGSGKGTQAEFIKQKYKLVHISTGDIFRENIKNQTDLGKLAQKYMNNGDLVPDNITIEMLKVEVDLNINSKGFLFDGFPRTVDQAISLDNYLEKKRLRIDLTIAIDVKDHILIERILNRGLTSGRKDDQDEIKIKNRFDEYNRKTSFLEVYYKNQNKFKIVDGFGKIDEVTKRLYNEIEEFIK
ncbi:MAG: adenylate kinase [Flavobacteriaceae bacterium]|tara:strand:- start:910 stop:1488 length:579 start_codon:yes stop_codon:yes gene_type:complete